MCCVYICVFLLCVGDCLRVVASCMFLLYIYRERESSNVCFYGSAQKPLSLDIRRRVRRIVEIKYAFPDIYIYIYIYWSRTQEELHKVQQIARKQRRCQAGVSAGP